MSRKHILPADAAPMNIRLRSEWRPGDGALIGDLHARGYADLGPRFGAAFVDHVRSTVTDANPGDGRNASQVWFAERGGEAIGCAAMIDRGGRGQLRWVIVLPEARGSGTGRALFTAAMDHAQAMNWADVFLETTDGLPAAMALYCANGFRVVSQTLTNLWDGPGLLITMVRPLRQL